MGTNWGEHSTTSKGETEDSCKRKLETKLEQNSMRDVWSEMKKITGFKVMDKNRHQQENLKGAEKLNRF